MLNGHQVLVERAGQLEVLDRDGKRRVAVDAVLTADERHSTKRLELAHARCAHRRRVEHLDGELTLGFDHAVSRAACRAGHDRLLPDRVDHWDDLQPPEVRLRHEEVNDSPCRRHHRPLLACIPDDRVPMLDILVRLGEHHVHGQVRRVLHPTHDRLHALGATPLEHEDPAALAREARALAADADRSSVIWGPLLNGVFSSQRFLNL